MNRACVEAIANAVLYEGYILYPYRPSVKNRQRWTFGGLYPETHGSSRGGEASSCRVECLVRGGPGTTFDADVRFLHLTDRLVGECDPPLEHWPEGVEPPFRPARTLRVGDRWLQSWQEAEERDVALGEITLGELAARPLRQPFTFPRRRRCESVRGPDGAVVGVLTREQHTVSGLVEVQSAEVTAGLFRLTLGVHNCTPQPGAGGARREDAALRALNSTHAILGVRGGEFVSMTDPPEECREAAAACRNVGVWPVLVGEEGDRDTMLASPIILPDYPQVAPESPGDLFDGTEIDEILTLRILTLTDDEKRVVASVDERAAALLARTEALAREQLMGLHSTVRGLRPVREEDAHG
jgi:hydrogenase maturation protease